MVTGLENVILAFLCVIVIGGFAIVAHTFLDRHLP